jgi:arsenate reductase
MEVMPANGTLAFSLYILPRMTDVFLHNPRCSKSRAALELVRDAGVEVPVREYLREPLSIDELRRIVQLLGVRPIDIVRRGEPQYAALGLNDSAPDDEVLRAMAEHPILIERPIMVRGERAVVGRPPETVQEIL